MALIPPNPTSGTLVIIGAVVIGTIVDGAWAQYTGGGITALTGDVTASGTGSVAATVVKVNGVSITGTPSAGQVPTATGSSAATWQTAGGGATIPNTTNILAGNGAGGVDDTFIASANVVKNTFDTIVDDGSIPLFDGATGRLIKNSGGVTISYLTDATNLDAGTVPDAHLPNTLIRGANTSAGNVIVGASGTKTTLSGSATTDRNITIPDDDGTLALVADVVAAQDAAETYADGLAPNYATAAQGLIADDVGGANGLVKSDGTGGISTAIPGTDYATAAQVASIPIAGSFSGIGTATTTFTVTIGVTMGNSTYKVNATPTALLSAAAFYVNNKTTTTFDVVYLAGLTGAVTFDWAVFP